MTTVEAPAGDTKRSEYALTYSRTMKSEWLRFWTLRSNLITLASICAAIVIFGVLAAAAATGAVEGPADGGGPPTAGTDPVSLVLSGGQMFGVLIMAVLGVLVGAREYTSGVIRLLLAAVPRRVNFMTSKIAVFVAITFPVALASVLAAFFAGTAILDAGDHASATITDPGVFSAVLGTAMYLVGIGVIGIAVGILLRNVGGGLATLIGGVLILPQIATGLLPDSWGPALKFLPSNAGTSMSSVTPPPEFLGSGAGVVVFAVWIIAIAWLAAVTLRSRDV